jgi:vacuolar-type H+-ATPase subunit C/Vma6
MQAAPAEPASAPMKQPSVNDLDYLGALLHGRRSRLAVAERLDGLCRLRDLAELGRSLYPDTEFRSAAELQRRLVQDLARELSSCLRYLEGSGADLLAWILARFQVENVKVLLRGVLNRIPFEDSCRFIVPLPNELALDLEALAKANSLDDFIARLPAGMERRWLWNAPAVYREQSRTFFLEAVLDCGYFQELLARTASLPYEEREAVKPLMLQEADTFHLMLALRGKSHYGLTPELLLPLHVRGSAISTERFAAMTTDPDPLAAATRAVGRVLDTLPSAPAKASGTGTPDLAVFEALAWKRFLRLAERAFRRGPMGLGVVFGYAGMRRVEVLNLITVSEAIRTGLPAEAMMARLIPRQEPEPAYV